MSDLYTLTSKIYRDRMRHTNVGLIDAVDGEATL